MVTNNFGTKKFMQTMKMLNMYLYNTIGFGFKIIYDYYIVIKSFLVFLTFQLYMQASPFFYHELNTNNTKTIPNQKLFKKLKLQF